MGVMPVGKLLVQISLPMMISMLVQALYNIVDSIFVAKISEDALTAVSLAFPIQNLMISTAVGTGVGINSLLSMRLGQKNQQAVDKTAMNGVLLAALTCIVFIILGFLIPTPYFASQTDSQAITGYGTTYLEICMKISFGLFGAVIFERLLQSTGRTMLSMVSQLTGAIINCILDPLLIFGLLGCPRMGIAGAAWATVIGQIAATVVSITLNLTRNKDIHFKLRYIRPDGKTIADIYKVGVPSILLGSIGSFLTYLLNNILGQFSTTAIAVYGVYFKLQSFIFMPAFGMSNGLVPTMSYNYGAKNRKRISEAIKYGILYMSIIMLTGMILIQLFAPNIVGVFSLTAESKRLSVLALKTASLGFIFAAAGIVLSGVCQALGNGYYSLIASVVRLIIVILPLAYLLSKLPNGVSLVWFAFPAADLASLIAGIILARKLYNEKVAVWGEPEQT